MELNAEQVKKALECCKSPKLTKCDGCPREQEDGHCMYRLNADALALIASQEQRIEELAQAHEMLSESYDHLEERKDELLGERSRLIEENNRMRAIPEQLKERLQAYFGTYVFGYKISLSEALKAVNQIAKEMLEESNERKD